MKFLFVFVFLGMVICALAKPGEFDKFDNVNIDEILSSDRLLNKYTDCLLDRGRCTSEAKTLKENLPDALSNGCGKCTKKQKESADKVIRHFVNRRKDLWKQLEVKYDPKGTYAVKYRDVIDGKKTFAQG